MKLETLKDIIKQIELFDKAVSIEEVKKGYKRRKKYIVETVKEKYFVKILPYKSSYSEIEKTKWIYKAYQKENIPLIPLLDIIVKENKTILIFKYFEGKDLEESSLTLEQYESYGRKVSLEVKKMNRIKNYPTSFKAFDLKNHCNQYINRLKKVADDKKSKMTSLFNDIEIEKLILRFQNLSEDIIGNEVMLNHNDIKTANVMLDKNYNFYLIDIEPIDLTYKGFNINYSIYTFLLNNNFEKEEKAFLKGFIKEYDPNKRLIKEWEYFIISDFINELERLLELYYEDLKNNISFIKKALFNEDNILVDLLYN